MDRFAGGAGCLGHLPEFCVRYLDHANIGQCRRQPDFSAESQYFFQFVSWTVFKHQLHQRAERHFFPMVAMVGFRQSRESVVNRMGRGQPRAFEAEPAEKRIRLDDSFSVVKTLQAIEDANVVILVVDAREGISDQDLSLLGFILHSGRSIVIAVNKWDGLDQDVKEEIKAELDRRLGFVDFARIHFISALHGSGVGHLFESLQEAYQSATRRIGTSLLTRVMHMAQEDHQPPLVRGRRVKLKYAHAGGYNPPRIIIHGNQVKDLPDSYKRYLMNYYRKSLKIMGTPIHIEFQEGENPFEGKKNQLTQSQIRKRRRLMKHVKKG